MSVMFIFTLELNLLLIIKDFSVHSLAYHKHLTKCQVFLLFRWRTELKKPVNQSTGNFLDCINQRSICDQLKEPHGKTLEID